MYYDSSIGKSSYKVPSGIITGNIKLKRQIIIENSILQKVVDVDLVGRDAILQEYLDVHANSKMKNIVASIQKEQNQVIRHIANRNIIVQGIAGSGKTSVALHRIAYLVYLYNFESGNLFTVTSKQFMILGPNNYFLEYISSVLPDLDVDQVTQATLSSLVSSMIKEKITIIEQSEELQEYFRSGLDLNFFDLESSVNFEKAIDKYIGNLLNFYTTKDILFQNQIIYNREFIASFFSGRNNKLADKVLNIQNKLIRRIKEDYKSGNGKFEKLLMSSISEDISNLPKDILNKESFLKKREIIREELSNGLSKTIKNHFSLANKTVFQHYINFIKQLDKYMNFEDIDEFVKATLKRLSLKKISRNDIALILLLKERLYSNEDFKDILHIMIDEAQDLSVLEFKALKSLFPNAIFSIFGDLNQAIFSYRSVDNWESVSSRVFDGQCDIYELNQSYRTTEEIMREANKISKYLTGNISKEVIRHGEQVEYLKTNVEDTVANIKKLIILNKHQGNNSIAIITKTENQAMIINEQLQNIGCDIHNVTSKQKVYNGGICTIASSLVKGLEFDATILVDVNSDNYQVSKEIDMKLLYVSLTRAIRKMSVLYTKDLPQILKIQKNMENMI